MSNLLYLGDNLDILSKLEKRSVDLVYLDPPFNKDKNFIVVDQTNINFFTDIWKGGNNTYLEELLKRLILIKEIMKDTASIFLHCDDTMSHYIKIMLDNVFGSQNFRNQIVWKRSSNTGGGKMRSNKFARNHDIIFWYTKTQNYKFNKQFIPYPIDELTWRFPHDDNDGKGPYHWNTLTYYTEDKVKELQRNNEIRKTSKKSKHPYSYKVYLNRTQGGIVLSDIWDDINPVHGSSLEYCSWPTQKPLKLLHRIIFTATDKGDIILDPYGGSGTTAVAATQLERYFISIDFSPTSLIVTKARLDACNLKTTSTYNPSYDIVKETIEYNNIRNMNKWKLQEMIISKLGGISQGKGADLGIDGFIIEKDKRIAIQCKGTEVGREVVDSFKSALQRQNLCNGILVAFYFSKNVYNEVSRLKLDDNINIKLVPIKELFNINMPIELDLTYSKEKVIAICNSPNGQIINYVWFIDNKVEIYNDKKGIFSKLQGKKGEYNIKCIAIDEKASTKSKTIKIKI